MKKNIREVLKKSLITTLSAAMVFGTVLASVPAEVKAAATTEKIARDEIANAEAKSYGPAGDGGSIWESFDGDTTTYTNSNYGDPANCKPQVYTITLKETVKLNKVRIHPRENQGGGIGNGAPNVCTVSVSTDGSAYTNVVTNAAVTDKELTWTDITFGAVSAKYVKLTMDSEHAAVVCTGEVELYKEVSDEPTPEDTKKALQEAYDQAKAARKGDYSEDAYRVLGTTSGLTECAKVVLADFNAVPADVVTALTDALNEVMESKPEQSIEKYKEQIREFKGLVEKYYVKGDFKPKVDQNLDLYYSKVEKVLANPNATTTDCSWRVYELVNKLRDMTTGRLSETGKEIYQMVIDQRADDQALYKPETWDAYEAACTAGWKCIDNKSTAADIEAAKNAIVTAKEALILNDVKLAELRQLAAEKSKVENDGYTRESWRAFRNAIWQIEELKLNNISTITEKEYQTLKSNLEDASAGLVKGGAGTETGNYSPVQQQSDYVNAWKNKETYYYIKGGQLYVSDEVANPDGTTTLTVTWINDGLDPEYGGLMHNVGLANRPEWSERPFTEDDWEYVKWLQVHTTLDGVKKTLYYDSEAGPIENLADCNGFPESQRDGFTRKITVPTGSEVSLELSGYDNDRNKARTYSLGVYQTKEVEPDATAPTIEVSIDSQTGKVTLKADEPLQDIEGWEKVDEFTFTKVFDKEGKYSVTVKDLAGNESVVDFEIIKKGESENPDKPGAGDKPNKPNEPNKPSDNKPSKNKTNETVKAVKTGDTAPVMGWTVISVFALFLAVFAAKKRRA